MKISRHGHWSRAQGRPFTSSLTTSNREFTVVETVVAMGLLAMVMMAMIAVDVSGSQLRMTTRQTEFLNDSVTGYFALLREQDTVDNVRDRINGTDWIALGPKGSATSDLGGQVGNGINVTATTQRILTEAEAAAIFGGTYDFDRDGTFDSGGSVAADYQTVVPVQLSVTWTNTLVGPGAVRTLVFNTIVYPAGSLQ